MKFYNFCLKGMCENILFQILNQARNPVAFQKITHNIVTKIHKIRKHSYENI